MFLTEFQVLTYFIIYVGLLLVSTVLVLLKGQWTFKDKLLRILILFLIPVLGLLILFGEQVMSKSFALLQKKETI